MPASRANKNRTSNLTHSTARSAEEDTPVSTQADVAAEIADELSPLEGSQHGAVHTASDTHPGTSTKESFHTLTHRDFTVFQTRTSKISLTDQDLQENRTHTDPATLDFMVLMQGREAIQESYRSAQHLTTLRAAQEKKRIPNGLKVSGNIRLYKPLLKTNLKIKALQSRYEKELLELIIEHHLLTFQRAQKTFDEVFANLDTTTNERRILIKWIVQLKGLVSGESREAHQRFLAAKKTAPPHATTQDTEDAETPPDNQTTESLRDTGNSSPPRNNPPKKQKTSIVTRSENTPKKWTDPP